MKFQAGMESVTYFELKVWTKNKQEKAKNIKIMMGRVIILTCCAPQ